MKYRNLIMPAIAAAALTASLAGCKVNAMSISASCAPGASNCSAVFHQKTGKPTPPVTVTRTATPAPTETPTVTASIGGCPVRLTYYDMQQLADSQAARIALAECMQIPADQQAQFTQKVALYALEALNSGQFSTSVGRQQWADSSLESIYGTYHQQ